MSTGSAHDRLGEIFVEETVASVAAATATATAATDGSLTPRRTPSVAPSLTYSESGDEREDLDEVPLSSEEEGQAIATPRRHRASTHLIAQNAADLRRITGESSSQLINRCCGGGCCLKLNSKDKDVETERVPLPDNDAFRSLMLKIDEIPISLTNLAALPEQTAFLLPVNSRLSPLKAQPPSQSVPETIPSLAPADASVRRTLGQRLQQSTAEEGSCATLPALLSPTDSAISLGEDTAESNNEQNLTLDAKLSAELLGEIRVDSDCGVLPVLQNSEKVATKEEKHFEAFHSKAREAGAKIQSTTVADSIEGQNPYLDTIIQPPNFVQPHPPYHVFPARIHSARELTRPGAEKRTYHFDLDVTDYPEGEKTDFRVGGAIGVMAPNDSELVEEVLDLLLVPRFLRDRPVLLRTTKGRWPTVWGDDKPRELVTTRRDLLTWCTDVQSYPPTKALLSILAEYASDENEQKVLRFLCSAEGQGVFCDFRTGPHVTLEQMLCAFPSAKPPLDLLLSILQPQMPRFYSLSNDPHDSYEKHRSSTRRLVEIAVTVHETDDWRMGKRTGIGSGFFERQALRFIEGRSRGEEPEIYVPMFKGLMANPLAKQFVPDGPMLLIGAGVGIAPFRGFVQRRLKTANCANKVWVLQGIRDSLVDELYSGEWGVHEDEVKRVVESRRGQGRYVQEEVRHQADLVWYVINSVDGRVFVCGSTRGMGEGVHEALVDVVMEKGNLGRDDAQKFWELKQEVGQYIAETW